MIMHGDGMKLNEFITTVISAITSLKRFGNLCEYFRCWNLLPEFLENGGMMHVKMLIDECNDENSNHADDEMHLYMIVFSFLKGNQYDYAMDILDVAQARFAKYDERPELTKSKARFDNFWEQLLIEFIPEKNHSLFVHFFTHNLNRYGGMHPFVLESFLISLVDRLRRQLHNPMAVKFLMDLIGQPFLLTSTVFITGLFRYHIFCDDKTNFIKYCWKEAMEDVIDGVHSIKIKDLFDDLRQTFPDEFLTIPSQLHEILPIVSEKFKTKEELENEWNRKNKPLTVKKFEKLVPDILPAALVDIIFDYTSITWILLQWNMNDDKDVTPSNDDIASKGNPSQNELTSQSILRVYEQFHTLMDLGRSEEAAEICRKIGIKEFREHIYPRVTTLDHYKCTHRYFEKNHELFVDFVVQDKFAIVKQVIIEYGYDCIGEFHITDKNIIRAVTTLLWKDLYEHIPEILVAVQIRSTKYDTQHEGTTKVPKFEGFIDDLITGVMSGKESVSFKRFLILHGNELGERCPGILETLCLSLIYYLKRKMIGVLFSELLRDFIGQPSLITTTAFTEAFLAYKVSDNDLTKFIELAWREAIAEGLEYNRTGPILRNRLVEHFQIKFDKDCSQGEMNLIILEKFKTKAQMEEEWSTRNAEILLKQMVELESHLKLFPTEIWAIITGYAISMTNTTNRTY